MQNDVFAFRADNVRKAFGQKIALDDVSLKLSEGITAILGKNGAGKSTLIRCALGLERPDKGQISIFGKPSKSRAARERVGIMLQDGDLPDLLKPLELVELFASHYSNPMLVAEVIEKAQLQGFENKLYKNLSGGQKRRVQFALSIVGNPDILFLDEPTTGLDSEVRRSLWSTVQELAKSGKTVCLTTHYLEEAEALADRVVVLDAGQIIDDGSVLEMKKRLGISIIQCSANLSKGELLALPKVVSCKLEGTALEIRTSDPDVTMKALIAQHPTVVDLSISRPNLEDVFEALTQ
ncbi:ABC transporter ATP-binding protein [Hirschia maritima]|uniref:ABC transporter ATP-binding protein n=1 Tax=Hirschia maritima TaxID=1121961 RepID=UPI00036DACE3|nr:ABC transporter ATP-binding protein [Hirschia maritima]